MNVILHLIFIVNQVPFITYLFRLKVLDGITCRFLCTVSPGSIRGRSLFRRSTGIGRRCRKLPGQLYIIRTDKSGYLCSACIKLYLVPYLTIITVCCSGDSQGLSVRRIGNNGAAGRSFFSHPDGSAGSISLNHGTDGVHCGNRSRRSIGCGASLVNNLHQVRTDITVDSIHGNLIPDIAVSSLNLTVYGNQLILCNTSQGITGGAGLLTYLRSGGCRNLTLTCLAYNGKRIGKQSQSQC